MLFKQYRDPDLSIAQSVTLMSLLCHNSCQVWYKKNPDCLILDLSESLDIQYIAAITFFFFASIGKYTCISVSSGYIAALWSGSYEL